MCTECIVQAKAHERAHWFQSRVRVWLYYGSCIASFMVGFPHRFLIWMVLIVLSVLVQEPLANRMHASEFRYFSYKITRESREYQYKPELVNELVNELDQIRRRAPKWKLMVW
jgi:hypothetical protein